MVRYSHENQVASPSQDDRLHERGATEEEVIGSGERGEPPPNMAEQGFANFPFDGEGITDNTRQNRLRRMPLRKMFGW